MKKIILGVTIMTLMPFIVILGWKLLSILDVHSGAKTIAATFGIFTTVFNYVIALLLVVKGHQEKGTLKDIKL